MTSSEKSRAEISTGDMTDHDDDAREEPGALSSEMLGQLGALRDELSTFDTDKTDKIQKSVLWAAVAVIALVGVISGLIVALH